MGFNSKPKLKKRTERGGKPEVYQYDHLPIEFRRQVIHLWISCIGSYSPTDFSRFLPPLENLVWDKIHNFLARNVGEFYFGNERYNSFAQCQYFLLDSNTPFDYLLKFIEYTFRFIENDLPRIRQRRYDELGEISYSFQSSEDAISELNHRFHQLDSGKFMDGREGNDYAAKVSLSGLGKGSSLAARNLGKSRLGGL
ncbi:MAG: hypothetical protein KA717_24460 [Woronichinia naegeliana WA131]|jgi:hypothetical protein|uniref:HEPN AbiJ-N-terminal domain-containing protein n=1 Tax=Woronichinia naegeliana WA131 TaxID=2824559 RepID=A0A977KSQ0_9CYAN|nr:MAG: hypothetical protein KA717_24460 [Woronichinia naegeliana WA131]